MQASKNRNLVIGADFGTDSVRVLIVNAATAQVEGEGSGAYPRWAEGRYCQPDQGMFRQHPLDYLEAFTHAVTSALRGVEAGRVRSIALDATGSTPCPVNAEGVPLALMEEFAENENAMFHLWKDHTAVEEAREVNQGLSHGGDVDYTRYQGEYSAEWYWAKILHTIRRDQRVKQAAEGWTEHCDWFVGELTGKTRPETMYRCACAAGHKALWHSGWNGLPSERCLEKIDPYMVRVARSFGRNVKPSDAVVGTLSPKWAERLGLPGDVLVGGCSLDAHAGAVGAGVAPGVLVTNIGTSAVEMLVAKPGELEGKNLRHACGMAENSILPGYVGIEAGQASFGDLFAWMKRQMMWPIREMLGQTSAISAAQKASLEEECAAQMLPRLTRQAERLDVRSALVGLDWFNGRRYPYINEAARGALFGLSLGVEPPEVFQGLVLAAVFGTKRIIESLTGEGLQVKELIAVGGIPTKSPYIMQTLSDATGFKIHISASTQACALGAAIYAAVAGGIYPSIEEAQRVMCAKTSNVYLPDAGKYDEYQAVFDKYCEVGKMAETMFS